MNKVIFRIIILIFFLGQVLYVAYQTPQIILLGLDFPDGVKLSLALAGMSLGVLFFTKEKKSEFLKDKPSEKETE